jgi:[ribosomal protein S18]-alanine N-acetyltransferase
MTVDTHGKVRTILRPMSLADLNQVEAIDQVSFPTPWPKEAFHYELQRNPNSLCWVAERAEPDQAPIVVATIVVWLILDEAHIGTLAVRPEYRQEGIGQQLLARTLLEAVRLGTTHALLEVRVSNQAAQNLYRKFGFEEVGVRKGYYQDSQEDAILMTLAPFDLEKLADLADPG